MKQISSQSDISPKDSLARQGNKLDKQQNSKGTPSFRAYAQIAAKIDDDDGNNCQHYHHQASSSSTTTRARALHHSVRAPKQPLKMSSSSIWLCKKFAERSFLVRALITQHLYQPPLFGTNLPISHCKPSSCGLSLLSTPSPSSSIAWLLDVFVYVDGCCIVTILWSYICHI